MRSDRLLGNMHKVLNHDLPNQVVAVHSLLRLLHDEEAARLSADGREYVRRLQNATRQASEMVRFLKEMVRLNSVTCKRETIALSALARELQGELLRKHAGKQFVFEWRWDVPAIVGDARIFLAALPELFAALSPVQGNACRVSASSAVLGDGVELAFHLEERPSAHSETLRPHANPPKLEERMEIILAREWLALADAELTLSTGAETRFSIVVPNR